MGLSNTKKVTKDIYKITNRINGKIYIGQSKNPKERFQSHCSPSSNKSPVDCAINKYGRENFDFEIIEKDIIDYNEKEKYWIAAYNSLVPNGYNISEGGKGSSGINVSGENSSFSIYSQDLVDSVIEQLINTNKSYSQIAEELGVNSIQTISYINKGKQWKNNDVKSYPIRRSKKDYIQGQIDTIYLLLKQGIPTNEIENLTGVGHSLISKINNGLTYKREGEIYPIRQVEKVGKNKKYSDIRKAIIKDLLETEKSFKEIANQYNYSISQIYKLNDGTLFRMSDIQYPLRKIQKRSKKKHISDSQAENIITLLKTTNKKYSEIQEITGASKNIISKINRGKTHKQINIQYPIRGEKK